MWTCLLGGGASSWALVGATARKEASADGRFSVESPSLIAGAELGWKPVMRSLAWVAKAAEMSVLVHAVLHTARHGIPCPSHFFGDSSFDGHTLVAIMGGLHSSVSIRSPSMFLTWKLAWKQLHVVVFLCKVMGGLRTPLA